MQAYTPQALVWASDWPFLRAPARIDYGPLLALFEQRLAQLLPRARRLLGFDQPIQPLKPQIYLPG